MYEGYTLDFVSPWTYGIAQYMIRHNKRAMINPATGNLVINAGWRAGSSTQRPEKFYHRKIFELKAIAERILGIDLIFLIISSTEYAVWRIEDEGATLTPFGFAIERHITFFTPIVDAQAPSTTKSNVNHSSHYCMIQPNDYKPKRNFFDWAYGYNDLLSGFYYLGGFRNDFQPANWDSDEAFVWDLNIDYLSYPRREGGTPFYICSARHPFQIHNGEVIKNLEMWRETDGKAKIRYDKEGEEDIIGSEFTYGTSNPYNYFAPLSPTKFIGADLDGAVVTGPDAYYEYIDYMGWSCQPDPVTPVAAQAPVYERHIPLGDSFYIIKFGDVEIGLFGTGWIVEHWKPWIFNLQHCNPGTGCIRTTYGAQQKGHRITWSRNPTKLKFVDYDNAFDEKGNVDKTFICCYYEESTLITYTDVEQISDGIEYRGFTHAGGLPNSRTYLLVYHINGGTVNRSIISTMTGGTFNISTWNAPDTSVYNSCGEYRGDKGTETTTAVDFAGQRCRDFSCQVTPSYLFYTYVLETYSGAAPMSLDDDDPTNWTFDSRILGIIDIETGKRTEHEVDDSLLGDLYKDTFDEEKASAVGLHRR